MISTMTTMNTIPLSEILYAEVVAAYDATSVTACKEMGLYTPLATPGKMTGMILEAASWSDETIRDILDSPTALPNLMADCVMVLLEHDKSRSKR
jgi:hypothetical protein